MGGGERTWTVKVQEGKRREMPVRRGFITSSGSDLGVRCRREGKRLDRRAGREDRISRRVRRFRRFRSRKEVVR